MTHDDIEDIYELSPLQQGMLFHAIYEPDSRAYFEQSSVPFYGELNVGAFTRAWQRVIDRHTILRTSFHWEHIDKPVQVVHKTIKMPIDHQDWCNLAPLTQARRLAGYMEKDRELGFDFSRAPLMRLGVVRLAEDEFRILWSLHHILLDGWSYQIVDSELWTLYEAFCGDGDLKLEPVRPYGDYIAWLQREDLAKAETYWRRSLKGFGAPTSFSSSYREDVGEESAQRETEYGSHEMRLAATCSSALQNLARRHHLTLNTIIQGAWAILLSRYCGEKDVIFGTVVSGRPPALPGVESMVGLFINTLPVRTQVTEDAFLFPWLKELQAQQVEARQYEYSPMLEIQRWSELPARVELFDSIIAFENLPVSEAEESRSNEERDGSEVDSSDSAADPNEPDLPEGTHYPICLVVIPLSKLQFFFYYRQQRFSASVIKRISGQLCTLLRNIASNPEQRLSEIQLLTEEEQAQLLDSWNATCKAYPRDRSIAELFEAQAAATPDATAFICNGTTLSYAELNRRANQLAHYLRGLGVRPEVLVGVCLERSFDFTVAFLGILKAGGAYLPLDPSYPQERLAFMLEDSRAMALITEKRFAKTLSSANTRTVCLDDDWKAIADHSDGNLVPVTKPEHLAYVIYTSGSTGRPKGVSVEHEQILNRLFWMWDTYPFGLNEVCCQRTALNFVDSIWELLGPLLRGVPAVIVADNILKDAHAFVHTLASHAVTRIWVVPSLLELLLETHPNLQDLLPGLNVWVSSGEPLSARLLERFGQIMPDSILYNLYGTSEVWDATWYDPSTAHEKLSRVPIGRPISNVQAYILDPLRRLVPIGVPGELYIGGVGLARGYLNLPELTIKKFISHPFRPGERLYRTGDLARYLPDGNIEFMGRIDHQIKIRGIRVELDEVESLVNQFPGVRQGLIVARENGNGDRRLLAHIIPNGAGAASQDDLGAGAERLSQWREIWDATYAQSPPERDGSDDFAGWVSSYTGAPIPADEMREYAEHLASKVLALQPKAILDIGCGTGLLLFRAAPHVPQYCATDFSGEAFYRLKRRLAANANHQVTLLKRPADDFSSFEASAFDLIVLNSVVQYFPTIDYLIRVIENGIKTLKRGGKIFIGDVRNLLLLEGFHTSVELHRASPSVPLAELRYRVQRRVAEDEQLAIDPAFFLAIRQRFPQISHVQIQPKRGRYRNEFTRFRYDVTLSTDELDGTLSEPSWVDWQNEQPTTSQIRQMLLDRPERLGIRRIRNPQFALEKKNAAGLLNSDVTTVEDLRRLIRDSREQGAIDPEELWSVQSELPYRVHLNWSGPEASDCYDVLFLRNGSAATHIDIMPAVPVPEPDAQSVRRHANDPLDGMFRSKLVRDLRDFLRQKLPEHMIPSAFSILQSFPLTPNGKIDRCALPETDLVYSVMEKSYVAPRTSTEEALAHLWQDVLGIGHLGVDDNFFELGGHSLTATRLLSRLRDFFQIELPLRSIFDQPTIAALAQFIEDAKNGPVERGMPPIRPLYRNAYAVVDSTGKLGNQEGEKRMP